MTTNESETQGEVEIPAQSTETTPDEERVIFWYTDLCTKIRSPHLSKDERMDYATQITHLLRALELGTNMDKEFITRMTAQVKDLETEFVYIGKLVHAVHELRRSSQAGISDPRGYEHAVKLAQEAMKWGVTPRVMEEVKNELSDYLERINAQQQH